MPSVDFRLYLVTDRHQTAGTSTLVGGGARRTTPDVRAVQLRERDLPSRELLVMAQDFQRQMPDAQLFINDRADLALGTRLVAGYTCVRAACRHRWCEVSCVLSNCSAGPFIPSKG